MGNRFFVYHIDIIYGALYITCRKYTPQHQGENILRTIQIRLNGEQHEVNAE